MKVAKIELRILALGDKNGSSYRCNPVVCRVYTSDGLYGDGEATVMTGAGVRASLELMRDLAESIIGMDPLDTELIWNKLYCCNGISRNGGPIFFAALSAIDIALWDMKGKYFGVPVYKLLGGKQRDSLRCYASMFNVGWGKYHRPAFTTQDYVDRALEAVGQGFTILKADFMMHTPDGKAITFDERTGHADPGMLDLAEERIGAVREAVGPSVELIVEGHGTVDAAVGAQFSQRLKKYQVAYYEEPCQPFLPICEQLARTSPVPLAGGERLYTRFEYFPFMQAQAYHLFQPDIGRCGGITETKKIIDLADLFELPVQLHCNFSPIGQAAVLQMEAAMNRFAFHEHTRTAGSAMIRELGIHDCIPEGGTITIPDVPGIGNELTAEALEHALECYVVQ